MKKIRKKDKGFTLIELLVTVAIVSVITVIGIFSIQNLLRATSNKQQEISLKNIKKSASQYTEEFKTLDKYWIKNGGEQANIEYACTTVGMLINKGFLKKDVIGLEIEVDGKKEKINEKTSIKIDRDIETKVFNSEDVSFSDAACNETGNIEIKFVVEGENENCSKNVDGGCPYEDWFNKTVTINIISTNADMIKDIKYTYDTEKGDKWDEESNLLVIYNQQQPEWYIESSVQGEGIDVCINGKSDINDEELSFCLSDDSLKYNMDSINPEKPIIKLDKIDDNYNIISHNASDNITNGDELVYYLSKRNETSTAEISWKIKNDTRTEETGEVISSYVIDKAGNKSEEVTGTLKIVDSTNVEPTEKYYCSLDTNNTTYSTLESATTSCTNREVYITPVENSGWYCSRTGKYYSSSSNAKNACKYTTTKTINLCPTSGSCWTKQRYNCVNGKWTEGTWTSSNHSCDGTKSWSCPSPRSGTSCNSNTYVVDHLTCSGSCRTSVTDYDNYYQDTYYTCSVNNYKYSTLSAAQSGCKTKKTGQTSTKYYCSLTNSIYNTLDASENACSNYCPSNGKLHEGGCYYFEF